LCSGSSTRSTQLTISAVVAESTDDVVVDWSASISPTAGSEVPQLYSDFLDTWAQLSWEDEDLRELPRERVIVTNHLRAVGHGSGYVWTHVGSSMAIPRRQGGRGARVSVAC
jgi:hypothetical protein